MGPEPAPLVSVVVTAYNVQPYITRTLESLAHQRECSVEIVVVDDGSSDGTTELLDDLGRELPVRPVIVRRANSGSSAGARNAGIEASRGAWIGFVDGDDWVDQDMYTTLLDAARSTDADLAIGGGQLVDHASGTARPFQDSRTWSALIAQQQGSYTLGSEPALMTLDASVCRRLYRRSFLERIGFRFADGYLFEDIAANAETLTTAERIVLVDHAGYFYRTGHAGRLTDRTDRKLLDALTMLDRAASALDAAEVQAAVWARFMQYQAWVGAWLATQIEERYAREFVDGMVSLGRWFDASGFDAFMGLAPDTERRSIVRAQCDAASNELWTMVSGLRDEPR